jgi:hypothetical protein
MKPPSVIRCDAPSRRWVGIFGCRNGQRRTEPARDPSYGLNSSVLANCFFRDAERPERSPATAQIARRSCIGQGSSAVALIVLLHVTTATAQTPSAKTDPSAETRARPTAEILAKGVIGSLLDSVPLAAEDRAQLQRLNAVVGSPFTARTLALTLGIASPPLMIVGLIWGAWSATQIKPKGSMAVAPLVQQSSPVVTREVLELSPRVTATATATARAWHTQRGDIIDDTGAIVVAAETHVSGNAALGQLTGNVAASDLASIVGGAAGAKPVVPCDYCIMPMIYPRDMPMSR